MSAKKKKTKLSISKLLNKIPLPLPGSSGKLFVGVNKALSKTAKKKK